MTAELGLTAAALHALGFLLYGRRVLAGEIEPNGVSWLMRGYGTAVLFVIWSGVGLPPAMMLHSLVTGVAAAGLAAYALIWRGCLRPGRQDYLLLACDVALLAGYAALVGTGQHLSMTSLVLAITAARKLAPYWPILRTTYERPHRERPGAWLIWAAGYAILGLAAAEADLPAVVQTYAAIMVAVHLALVLLTRRGTTVAPSDPARRPGGGMRQGAPVPVRAPTKL